MIKTLISKKDLFAGGILLVLGMLIFLHSRSFPALPEGYPGPGLFPKWIAAGIAISGIWLIGKNIIKPSKSGPGSQLIQVKYSNLIRLGSAIFLIGVFPFLSDWIGFLPALGIVCFGFARLFQLKYGLALCVGLGTPGLVYLIFSKLLSVPL